MKKIAFLVIASLAIVANSSAANSQNIQYRKMGAGGLPCGTFLKQPHYKDITIQWMLGFVTAMNFMRAATGNSTTPADILNGANGDAMEVWLTNYCNENPLNDVGTAAIALTDQVTSPK